MKITPIVELTFIMEYESKTIFLQKLRLVIGAYTDLDLTLQPVRLDHFTVIDFLELEFEWFQVVSKI